MCAFVKPLSKGSLLCRLLTASAAAGLGMVGAIPVAVQAQTNCAPVPSGLVSWWRAESNALDSVDSNSGFLSNGVSFAVGEVGQAFSFDGTSGYVAIPPSSGLDVGLSSNGMTIECWIRPDDLSSQHALAEWNDGAGQIGTHVWISIPDYGGLGSIFANFRDT